MIIASAALRFFVREKLSQIQVSDEDHLDIFAVSQTRRLTAEERDSSRRNFQARASSLVVKRCVATRCADGRRKRQEACVELPASTV